MTINVDVLTEAYSILKQYIPQKDRQEAADNLMSIMVDYLDDQDLKELSNTDAAMGRAFKEYGGAEEEYEDYDE
jgi:hypothetical protein